MSQAPITIYVGSGNLDTAPSYRFFLDESGSSEITDLTLLASQTYTFKRLGASNSHPFYISDSGYEQTSSDQLVLTGDGDYENGITGDQSFTLSFANPSTAPSLSLNFYCTSHSQMIQEVEIKSFIFNDKDELKAAVNEWCDDEAAAREKYGDINDWDVSDITNFASIFSGKTEFNSDISNWDVSNGTLFNYMFNGASSFNQDIGSWDVSNGTYFGSMFNGASSFNQDIGSWDVSNANSLSGMFREASSFNQDIGDWDVGKVLGFQSMFQHAKAFNQDIGDWDVSNADRISWMFDDTSFNQDISEWDVGNVLDFSGVFSRNDDFNQDLSSWDVSNGEYFAGMFDRATNFNQDISNWDVSKGANFWMMFWWAEEFNSDISGWDVSNGTKFSDMFGRAYSFNQDIGDWNVSNGKEFAGMFQSSAFDQDISDWDVSNGEYFQSMFAGNPEFSHQGIRKWKIDDGDNLGNMFYRATKFLDDGWQETPSFEDFNYVPFTPVDRSELDTAVEAWINDEAAAIQTYGDINEWDVSNITDFSRLFDGKRDFNSEISDWDVSNGTDFSGMFRQARAFNQDIGDWDLSKGENLGTMFEGARSFNQDIGDWDVGQASSMFNMFNYTNFNQDIGEWDVGNVVNFAGMFQVSVFDQDISDWDVSSGNYFEYMFHRAPFDQDIGDWKFSDSFSLRDMFSYSKFNQDISGWDVGDARSFGQMFQGNKEFDQDLRSWNVPDDASLLRMFTGADKMLAKGWLETPESSNFAPAPPSFSSLDEASIIEKSANNHVIYQALADHWTDVKYSLSGDNSDLFDIDEISGKVRFLGNAKYDDNKPENNEKSFIVRATDQYGDFTEKTVDFIIEDSSLAFWKDSGYRVDAAAFKDGLPSANAVVLKDRYNNALSDEISRTWNGVSVIKSNDGYRMLQVAERGRRRGQYRIAELNSDGVLQSVGAWVDEDQAVADRYQELFELDLNNDGQIAIPAAVDVDLDGFADGLGHYRLMGNGMSVDLSDDRGSTISAKTSRNWNAVVSKQVGDGFQVVIQGERGRRRSQFQVWSTDVNGMVIDKSSWLDGAALASQGYEQTFNRDFNNDSYVGVPAITSSSDANGDGFVDGLGHYMLMGLSPSSAVDFIDNRGRRLTPQSSRSWNALSAAPNPDDPSSGFEVLIQGERGRRRSQYQVWSTDASGQVTSKSSWLNRKALAQQGYETTFSKDFDGDALIGAPSGSSLVDQDSNGLVDGIIHYALLQGSGNTAQSVDLKDRRGRVLSDSSSRTWNVIQAADNGNGFDVLLQGERGRRQSQYLLWKADPTGLITEKSGWMTGDQLAVDGYESVFGLELNDNGTIGL